MIPGVKPDPLIVAFQEIPVFTQLPDLPVVSSVIVGAGAGRSACSSAGGTGSPAARPGGQGQFLAAGASTLSPPNTERHGAWTG